MARKRRSFTAKFKCEVVQLIRQSGKSVAQVCREMDLSESAVSRWLNRADSDDAGSGAGPLTTDERAELHRLRRENRRLEMERGILKKATAFFAKENG